MSSKSSADKEANVSSKRKQCQAEQRRQNVCLPETGFLRAKQIIGDKKSDPPIPALIPISAASLYRSVNEGRFPKPIKLSPGTSVWRVEDIRLLIELIAKGELEEHDWR